MRSNLITNSRADCFMRCPREHYYRYELGILPIQVSEALTFGTAWHYALETDDLETACNEYRNAMYANSKSANIQEEVTQAISALRAMYSVYKWRWQNSGLTFLEREKYVETPLDDFFLLAGMIDGITEDKAGKAVFEQKTTKYSLSADSPYWEKLLLDRQITGYLVLAKTVIPDIDRIIYDVAKKPSKTTKQLTQKDTLNFIDSQHYAGSVFSVEASDTIINADGTSYKDVTVNGEPAEITAGKRGFAMSETNVMYTYRVMRDMTESYEDYFVRKPVYREDEDLLDYFNETRMIAKQIKDCTDAQCHPKNPQGCMSHFGGKCPYHDLCVMGYDPYQDSLPSNYIKTDNVHPELKPETAN